MAIRAAHDTLDKFCFYWSPRRRNTHKCSNLGLFVAADVITLKYNWIIFTTVDTCLLMKPVVKPFTYLFATSLVPFREFLLVLLKVELSFQLGTISTPRLNSP